MDAGEVERLGRFLQQQGERLDDIAAEVGRLVASAAWGGGDGTDFLLMWPTHRARLQSAGGGLSGLGRSALNNASEQRRVSAASGGLASATHSRAPSAIVAGRASPEGVATWWAGLSAQERDALIRTSPDLIGNLDGIPPADRYAANRLRIEAEIRRSEQELAALEGRLARRGRVGAAMDALGDLDPSVETLPERLDWLRARLARLREASAQDAQIWYFDPSGDGRIAQVIGDLATADNVAVVVPGMTNDMHNFDAVRTNAWNLEQAMRRASPGTSHATIAWLGYDTPDDGPGAASPGAANDGSMALRNVITEVDRVNSDGRVSVVAHSYGSVVAGRAMQSGLDVEAVAVVGSPGMGGFGSSSRADLGSPGIDLYAGTHAWDPVPFAPTHGEDPSATGFGSTRFETDVSGHSSYFHQGSRSLDNLARIAVGRTPR
jgi:hypothetical protein